MNKIFFNISVAYLFLAISCTSHQKRIWVYDHETILTEFEERKLDSLFSSHEKKTTNEIVLVTTNDFGTDSSILFYSVNFLRHHGIGKKGKNNGVLIVYNGAMRQVRIGTGYGTEKFLKDEIAWRIIDSCMLPEFRQGNAFEGLWQGSSAIVTFLERPENKIL